MKKFDREMLVSSIAKSVQAQAYSIVAIINLYSDHSEEPANNLLEALSMGLWGLNDSFGAYSRAGAPGGVLALFVAREFTESLAKAKAKAKGQTPENDEHIASVASFVSHAQFLAERLDEQAIAADMAARKRKQFADLRKRK